MFKRLKRGDSEEIVASQSVDLVKAFDAKYFRTITSSGRLREVRPWKWYREVGEIHYAISRTARIAGYARITARKLQPDGTPGEIITKGPQAEVAAMVSSPYGGSRALIERFYTLMKVAGDCWLIRCRDDDGDIDGYDVLSASEISRESIDNSGLQTVSPGSGFAPGAQIQRITYPTVSSATGEGITRPIKATDFLGRIWRPSNQFIDLADSPMTGVDVEAELLWMLTMKLKGNLLSRLAMNGIIFVPNGLNEVRSAAPSGKAGEFHQSKVLDNLINAATWNVQHIDDAMAAVPIFISGDKEMADSLKHIILDQSLAETDLKLRAELINRILTSLDGEPESVKGKGDTNHWSSWSISDDERRIAIQPDMEAMCWALTRYIYNRELLDRGLSPKVIAKSCLWYDLTNANVNVNQVEDSRQALDRNLIGPKAARRLQSLSDADAPTDIEQIQTAGRMIKDGYLATFGNPEQANIDWTKVGSRSGGPDPAEGGPDTPEPKAGPGVGTPGSPGGGDSDTPRKDRPA